MEKIQKAFDPELFREQGHKIIDTLANYLSDVYSGNYPTTLPNIPPDEMLKKWDGNFGEPQDHNFDDLLNNVITQSNHLHNPKYIGHQVCVPLPSSALFDFISKLLNNGSVVYEMGPVNVIMEKRVIEWMSQLIGYDTSSDGVFTAGGTVGNLTALLAARQAKAGYDIWKEGIKDEKLSIMVPELSHYSISRAASIMGMGENSIISLPYNNEYRTDINLLENKYSEAIYKGRKIIAIVGNACSTAVGNYDNLERIADFSEKYNLWFHVDGAHGASALLSKKYRHLLKGVQRADSVVWDAHKMMLMPALITAVIFRDGISSYESFSQKASYLYENTAKEEWYNLGHRTIECTKTMMGAKLYLCLKQYGQELFGDYVTSMYDLTKEFAQIIKNSGDFDMAVEPDSNIICFRYIKNKNCDMNVLQKNIRSKILENEKFYIVQTMIKDKQYLRCTIINPLTKLSDLIELLELIRSFGF